MGIFDGVLLVSDVDGTLLDSRHEVTGPVRSALDYFVERGGLFTVATGRSLCGFSGLRAKIPLNAPAILSNGAYLYDCEAGREIYSEWLTGPIGEALADIYAHFPGLGTEIHWPDRVAILHPNRWHKMHMTAVGYKFTEIPVFTQAPTPWLKILFVDEHATLRKVAEYTLSRYAGLFSLFFSAPCLLEMQNSSICKSAGVNRLAELLKVSPEDVYTAGDAGNDIDMLQAFTSFAPATGTQEARAAASYIVRGNDDHALAEAVEIIEAIRQSN